jgi:hypothetical protein
MKSPQYSVTQVNDVFMVRSMKSKLAVTKASEKAGADSAIKMLNALGFGGAAAQERQEDGSLLVWLESYL